MGEIKKKENVMWYIVGFAAWGILLAIAMVGALEAGHDFIRLKPRRKMGQDGDGTVAQWTKVWWLSIWTFVPACMAVALALLAYSGLTETVLVGLTLAALPGTFLAGWLIRKHKGVLVPVKRRFLQVEGGVYARKQAFRWRLYGRKMALKGALDRVVKLFKRSVPV